VGKFKARAVNDLRRSLGNAPHISIVIQARKFSGLAIIRRIITLSSSE
jgi:hypothetical protein